MADILCPMCGKPNPAEAEICWSCQARLKPLQAPQPGDDSVPDWLRDMRAGQGPEETAPSGDDAAGDADIPDWLARIRQRGQEEGSTAQDEAAEAASDLPDWMKDLRAGEQEPASQSSGDLPAWMKDEAADSSWLNGLREEDTSASAAPVEGAAENDWLSNLSNWGGDETSGDTPEETQDAPQGESSPAWASGLSDWGASPQAPEQPGTPEPPDASEGEDWLSKLNQSAPEEPPGAGAQVFSWDEVPEAGYTPGAAMTGQLPDWLGQTSGAEEPSSSNPFIEDEGEDAPPAAEAQEGSAGGFGPFSTPPFSDEAPVPELPGGDETPEWLKAFAADLPGAGEPADGPFEAGDLPELGEQPQEQPPVMPFENVELPDWLEKNPPLEDKPEQPPAFEGGEDLAMAQLPGWLAAMRPVESVVPQNAQPAEEDDRVEKSGPLAGLVGALPGESLATRVSKPAAYSARLRVSDRQSQQAALIEEMLGDEARPQAPRGERSHIPERIVRVVIALVLIAALLLPLASNLRSMPLPNLFQPDTVAFQRIVEALPAGAPVLLAVEYEPGLSGEMQLAAAPVVSQLNARSSRLALISTNPSGPVLAENLLGAAGVRESLLYTNLGFLPGGTAGLQEFASRPRVAMQYGLDGELAWNTEALTGVAEINQFGAVIVLTENAETARAWIEQVQPGLGGVPLLMVVSAQAAPMVQPYIDSGQVQGMVSGMSGGAMYAQITSQGGAWLDYWDAYQFGIFAAIAFILLGGVVQIFSLLFRRPARRKA